MARRRGAFTLVEVLVVFAILGVLAAILLPAVRGTRLRSQRSKAWSEVKLLEVALSMYHADTRRFPRLAPRTAAGVFRDDAPALTAALHNEPLETTGGGPNAPYVRGTIRLGRLVDRRRLEPDTMGQDGVSAVVELTEAEMARAASAPFQSAHGPLAPEPLVFVDPWGAPYHYREWDSVPVSVRGPLEQRPPARTGFVLPAGSGEEPPVAGPVVDAPMGGFQLWSNGPNGINEFGEGDDVASWKGLR